jgi:N-methylhydantoinase A
VGCDLNEVDGIYRAMEEEALRVYALQGLGREKVVFARSADLRYIGQEHTVRTPVPAGRMDDSIVSRVRKDFDRLHEQSYTFQLPGSAVEFVNFNLTAFGTVKKARLEKMAPAGRIDSARTGTRLIDFDEQGRLMSQVFNRGKLGPGHQLEGPAVVEEDTSVTVVYPGQTLSVDEYGNLIIETGVR